MEEKTAKTVVSYGNKTIVVCAFSPVSRQGWSGKLDYECDSAYPPMPVPDKPESRSIPLSDFL